MKQKAPKIPKYPRITVRVDAELLARIESVRGKSDLSFGQIFSQAMRRYLPELEKFHAAK